MAQYIFYLERHFCHVSPSRVVFVGSPVKTVLLSSGLEIGNLIIAQYTGTKI